MCVSALHNKTSRFICMVASRNPGNFYFPILDAPELKAITPLTHAVYKLPCECAVGEEGIADVYESVILNAVVSEVEGGEGRVGLEQNSNVTCSITRERIAAERKGHRIFYMQKPCVLKVCYNTHAVYLQTPLGHTREYD